MIESDSFDFMRHYVRHERAIAFQIPIGLDLRSNEAAAPAGDTPAGDTPAAGDPGGGRSVGGDHAPCRVVARPLPERDVPGGELLIGRLRGRTLPVAAARFVKQAADALDRSVAAS